MNTKYLLLFLFIIPFVNAVDVNVTLFCSNADGLPCNATTVCEATVFDINFNLLVGPNNMTFISNGFYNLTVDQPNGRFNAFATCTDTDNRQVSTDLSFIIGGEETMTELAIIAGLGIITFLFFSISTKLKLNGTEGRLTGVIIPGLQTLFMLTSLVFALLIGGVVEEFISLNSLTTLGPLIQPFLTIAIWIVVVAIAFYLVALLFEVLKVMFLENAEQINKK